MLDRNRRVSGDRGGRRRDADGEHGAPRSVSGVSSGEADDPGGAEAIAGGADSDADRAEWDDCVPGGIVISEARRQQLREEHERYLAELIEEVGQPTAEEMARAEAWWRPIEQHLKKSSAE